MEIYVYDFDGTIYDGDSSVDFFLFTLKRYPFSILKIGPRLTIAFLCYFLKKIKKEKLKESFFSFLKYVPNVEEHLEQFWVKNYKKMKDWYLKKEDHSRDVIISASPEFLLDFPSQKLKIYKLIASEVDKRNGCFLSANCYGEEKVRRLEKECPQSVIEEFYSDTFSDRYLVEKAEKAYLVKGNQRKEWVL